MNSVQNPSLIPWNTGWFSAGFLHWFIIIPNILGSIIPQLIINQGGVISHCPHGHRCQQNRHLMAVDSSMTLMKKHEKNMMNVATNMFKGASASWDFKGCLLTTLRIHGDGTPDKHDFQSQTQRFFLSMVMQETRTILTTPPLVLSESNVKL